MRQLDKVFCAMINTAQLQRLDRPSVESKATFFAGVLCLVLWITLGATVKLFFDDWGGFGVGFVVAALLSGLVMWILYIRPSAKEKRVVRASWRGSALRVFDPIAAQHESIDFSMPHRAILILSKPEREFLLRLEQNIEQSSTRIDIIGQTPMALPMPIAGEAQSLYGFFSLAKTDTNKSKPYRMKEVADKDLLTHSLLHFVEQHKEHRNNEVLIKKENETIKLANGAFSLLKDEYEIMFNNPKELQLDVMVRTTHSTRTDGQKIETAQIFMGLIPPSGAQNALVFSAIAPTGWSNELPSSWDIPKNAESRKFTLYDDSVNSYIVTKTLKNYIKLIAPNNPVLDILRH